MNDDVMHFMDKKLWDHAGRIMLECDDYTTEDTLCLAMNILKMNGVLIIGCRDDGLKKKDVIKSLDKGLHGSIDHVMNWLVDYTEKM